MSRFSHDADDAAATAAMAMTIPQHFELANETATKVPGTVNKNYWGI